MHNVVFTAIVVLALWVALAQWRRRVKLQRLEYIRTVEVPEGLFEGLWKRGTRR